MLSDIGLWNRISTFTLDDPEVAFSFSDRLARENSWTRDFARDAVEEYRRFLYLAATGDRPSTPSDIVDQVWHLHLTYTRSYWDGLCGEVLGRALHHGPTKGGPAEEARYRTQYAETLQRYHAEFGIPAPARFWPDEDTRFSSAPHLSWVDRRDYLVVRKSALRSVALGAAAAGLPVALAGSAVAAGTRTHHATPALLVAGGVALGIALLVVALSASTRGAGRKRGDGSGDGGFIASDLGSSSGKGGHGGHGGKDGAGHGGHGGDGGGHGGDGGSGCGGGGCGGGGCSS